MRISHRHILIDPLFFTIQGCKPKIHGVIINHLPVAFSAMVLLGCIEMLVIVLSCYVCRAIKRAKSYK